MSKHTPGPWRVIYDEHGYGNPTSVSPKVCTFNWMQLKAMERKNEVLGNAHLIAAAPNLLSALKALVNDTECGCEETSDRGPIRCKRCDAEIVISKAEGSKK